MKKKVKWIISIIVVALVGLLIFDKVTINTSEAKSGSSEKITVVAATSGSPKPFTYEEDGELTGQNIELIKAVFEKLPQYKLKIVKVEFSSIFSGLTSGRYQIAVNNLAKNAEREKIIFLQIQFLKILTSLFLKTVVIKPKQLMNGQI